jgi:hypothetical protein
MQVSSYHRNIQHVIRKYSKNFLVLFCALGMQIAASYSAYAEPIDPPEDPLGKAIFESLNCSDSHYRPGKALTELLTELEKLNLVRLEVDPYWISSSRDRLVSLRPMMSLIAQSSWYWSDRGKIDVCSPGFDPIDKTKNWHIGAAWLRDRCHYNLIVEEASHAWVDKVGVETALRQTQRYAAFLAQTGARFDPEAFIYAILEEKGRRMVNFETDRYACRGVYRDWLKENGGIKKLHTFERWGSPLKYLPQERVPRTPFSLPRSIAKGILSPGDIILSVVDVGCNVASENYGAPWSKTAAIRRQMEAYDYMMTHGIPATGISAPGYVPVEVTREASNWQSWNLNAEAQIRRDCSVLGHTVPDELGMGLMKELMLRESCKAPKRPACLPAP